MFMRLRPSDWFDWNLISTVSQLSFQWAECCPADSSGKTLKDVPRELKDALRIEVVSFGQSNIPKGLTLVETQHACV